MTTVVDDTAAWAGWRKDGLCPDLLKTPLFYQTWYLAREACAAQHGVSLEHVEIVRLVGDARHYAGDGLYSRLDGVCLDCQRCARPSDHEGACRSPTGAHLKNEA